MNPKFYELSKEDQAQVFKTIHSELQGAISHVELAQRLVEIWGIDLSSSPEGDLNDALDILIASGYYCSNQEVACRRGMHMLELPAGGVLPHDPLPAR